MKIVSLFLTLLLLVQGDQLKVLHEKTDARLRELVNGTKGVTGLVVVDLTSGERFAFNENQAFPQASAIKVTVLMEVYKQARAGKFKLTDLQWIDKQHQIGGTGVLKEIGDHTSQLSIHDMAVLMIVLSDNTATNILIDLVGMKNVNETLRDLGLNQTRLQRRMIDPSASARGNENLSTPAEAARVMEMLYRGQFVDRPTSDEILSILRKPKSGRIPSGLPSGVSVAFKPGDIAGVATDWAIVELKERPYIVIFMENYSLESEPTSVARDISRTAYDHFWRLGRATKYGTYLDDPSLLRE
jgi:beta-lactamase class A